MVLVLRVLTALKTNKVTTQQVDTILEQSSNEAELDAGFARAGIDMVKYKEGWAKAGINNTMHTALATLITDYYSSYVEYILQSVLKIKGDAVKSNADVISNICKEVANKIDNVPFNTKLSKIIQSHAKDRITNSEEKYKKIFNQFEENPDTILAEPDQLIVKITDGMESLRNIKGEEIYSILRDLHKTGGMYRYAPKNGDVINYSIYLSFLREYFRLELPNINARMGNMVTLSMPDHADIKFKKLDELMALVIENFIIPGITKQNLPALNGVAIKLVKAITITNTAAIFGIDETGESTGGNLNSAYVFKSAGAAKTFDQLITALISLSKLRKYLVDAEVSVYSIDPSLFEAGRVNPAYKFFNLEQLVKYNGMFCEIRDRYEIQGSTGILKAFSNRNSEYFLSSPNTPIPFVKSSDFELYTNLYDAVDGIFSEDEFNGVILTAAGGTVAFHIWDLVRAMYHEINPYYALMPTDRYPLTVTEYLFDPDAMFDEDYARVYLTELFGKDPQIFYRDEFTYDDIRERINHAEGGLKEVLKDLNRIDIESEVELLVATYNIAEDLVDLRTKFKDIYRHPTDYSRTEYSSLFSNAEMFQEVIPLVTFKSAFSSRRENMELVVKVATILIKKYYPQANEERVHQFLYEEPESSYYGNFISAKVREVYTEIVANLGAVDSHFINISETGKSIFLKPSELDNITCDLETYMPVPLRTALQGQAVPNDLGYYVNKFGEPYVTHKNNVVGALHTLGYYIFTDGTVEKWRPI